MIATSTSWIEEPLARFVRDTRSHLALVIETSGRVVTHYGFTRRLDLMTASALAAAIHASASELGRQLQQAPFGPTHHSGSERQLFLAPLPGPTRPLLLLAIFERESSLGLVRLFWESLRDELAGALTPALAAPVSDVDFEQQLQRSLSELFGGE